MGERCSLLNAGWRRHIAGGQGFDAIVPGGIPHVSVPLDFRSYAAAAAQASS